MTIGEKIRAKRKEEGLTQVELGRRIGSDQVFISYLENGNRTPTIRTLQRIAKGLGCELTVLFENKK
jgi:transcriptional regulator with XRE-family HTH domain